MELLGIGLIAAGFSLYLALVNRERRQRREEMGLGPLPAPRRENWTWPPLGKTRVGIDHRPSTRDIPINAGASPQRPPA
jgi:hypothetical protein